MAAVGGAAGVAAAVVVPVLVLGVVVAPVPSDAPGISEQQLKVWRETFERKVAELEDDARSLMSNNKANLIVNLLRSWDSSTPRERKSKTPNYMFFKNHYMLCLPTATGRAGNSSTIRYSPAPSTLCSNPALHPKVNHQAYQGLLCRQPVFHRPHQCRL